MDRIEKLNNAMKDRGHTQESLARELGVTMMTIFRWLHRKNTPKGLSIIAIDRWIEKNDYL